MKRKFQVTIVHWVETQDEAEKIISDHLESHAAPGDTWEFRKSHFERSRTWWNERNSGKTVMTRITPHQ